jgi:hypothetical protein
MTSPRRLGTLRSDSHSRDFLALHEYRHESATSRTAEYETGRSSPSAALRSGPASGIRPAFGSLKPNVDVPFSLVLRAP